MYHIHHVGYLVKNINKSRVHFEALGYEAIGDTVYDEYRDIDILFMKKDNLKIELVSPSSEKSIVTNLVNKYKNSPYHMCYECDDFDAEIHNLEENGFTRFEDPMPAPAIFNRRVCYLMSSRIGLIELLESEK